MVLPALELGQYEHKENVDIGRRPSGRRHRIDVLATDGSANDFLISLKWQQSRGTVEQKVVFETMCLAHALNSEPGRFREAYLILGGEGFTLREFYIQGGLDAHLKFSHLVKIRSLESFVALANQGRL